MVGMNEVVKVKETDVGDKVDREWKRQIVWIDGLTGNCG